MAPDYQQLMDELRAGSRSEIEVTPETFGAFRTAWTDYPNRDEIVGQAKRGGNIVYRYKSGSGD